MSASAKPEYLRTVVRTYGIKDTPVAQCTLCHLKGGGSALNRFGKSFFANGADSRALSAIEADDSDNDGFSNLEEFASLTSPGDPRSRPGEHPSEEVLAKARRDAQKKKASRSSSAAKKGSQTEVLREITALRGRLDALESSLNDGQAPGTAADEIEKEEGFAIDLGEEPEADDEGFDISFGDEAEDEGSGGLLEDFADNFQWGGALDFWVRWVNGGESTSTHPLYAGKGTRELDPFVHVAELVLTTRIGDNITLLAEMLLPTEEGLGMRQLVAEKHGFFYAIFNGIDALPKGSTVWLGRFRIPYGIDAVLDAPASPLDTLVTKITGQISDVGLMWTGFKGPFEWSIAIADGADFSSSSSSDTGLPLYARTDLDLSRNIPGLHVGLSGFLGDQYRYADGILRTPNSITGEDIVYKKRVSAHVILPIWKFGFYTEATVGKDDDDTFHSFFIRSDYNFTPELVGHLVWDYLKTDFRETAFAGDPNPSLAKLATDSYTGEAEQFLRMGISYHVSEQIILRLIDDIKLAGSDNHPDNVLTSQFLLEF
jgi:hypothetical protein